ncbi:unnamed protein product [Effrenium voratum]|uniref:Glucosidase II subunit alpha n=1 Tax=Effrenium voratum TaxID=2562239 RepID=A0AA36NFR3_9DINO|nr:unnamed protein product [Effrenium voratum]
MEVPRLLACLVLALVLETGAVDRSKFRTCEQGSFCRRYKKWIARPEREKALWEVLPQTRTPLADGGVSFQVKHTNEAIAHLLLKLNIYASGMVRIRLNEIEPLHTRHEIPAGDVVTEPPPKAAQVSTAEETGKTVFKFAAPDGTEVQASLHHAPLGLEVAVGGQVLQRLNARNLLNFERYRKPKERLPPDSAAVASPDAVLLDAAAHPHELDTNGLWEEPFGGHTDQKPRGPASLGMDVSFLGDVPSLFGLPEHATKASLPFYQEPYRFFNLDVFEYEIDEPMALYGAIPIIWAIHRLGGKTMASGFLWINPSETFVKLERDGSGSGPAHAWWTSESGVLDTVVMVGPTPKQVSAQFHDLTGHGPMPGLWALGKHQCRWNYMTEKDVATVDSMYDKYDIPYDTIWLDIEHTDGKAYFSWNSAAFPNPKQMVDNISAKRRKFVNVVDPHIKKEEKFHVYREVRDKGLFTKKVTYKQIDDPSDAKPADWVEESKISDPSATQPPEWNAEEDGPWVAPQIDNPAYKGVWHPRKINDPTPDLTDFEGWCWPGTSLYPDFTNPEMREYWGSQFALDKYAGTNADTYIWNDMNEPSVFNGPEVTMPRDAVHPYGMVEHRDVHNMYGYYVHRATFEGLAKRTQGDRPFVLTRSFFIGSHKYSAIWTGDNYAQWSHLKASIAMVGALTLGGQSLVGADVGGFFKHPDQEMTVRWYQLAVLIYPFLRNHAHLETPRREPYVFDEPTMLRIKASLQLRYKMLPLWYTLFHQWNTAAEPVVRPLFWDFLDDPQTHENEQALEDQIMLGEVLLVHGITKPSSEQTEATVYLPKAAGWYSIQDGAFKSPGAHVHKLDLDSIPAYYKAGTVVPLKSRIRRSSACMSLDPFTLNVYLDPQTGHAKGRLYIDDYRTRAYEDGKSFLDIELEFKDGILKASSRGQLPEAAVGAEIERVEIFGLKSAPQSAEATVAGKAVALPVPKSRALDGSALHAAVVKVKPFVDMRSEWQISVK